MKKRVPIQTNVVYEHLTDSQKRITIEQGGSRSGKTYNILMWIILDYARNHQDCIITIVRKTFPALRASAMRDFIEIMSNLNIYSEKAHNKTNNEYRLNKNLIEFVGLDQAQKIRGRKRDLLFINEANELTFEDWQQLIMRTTDKIIIDFNPSDEFHWIYDRAIPRDDADFYQTTYLDNPFLEHSLVSEIERLKDVDENYWRVYGLGERGQSKALIFNKFKQVDTIPENAKLISYGLDFGYSIDPTALIATYKKGDELFFEELIYLRGLTNYDLVNKFKELKIETGVPIIADSAEPKSIEEIRRYGFNIHPSVKGKDSIIHGITFLKQHKLNIKSNGVNLLKEFRNYKYQEDRDGNIIQKPVDLFNHSIDAIRYSLLPIYKPTNKPVFFWA